SPLVVTVNDTFGNHVPGAIVSFAAPAGGPSASFSSGTGGISGATNASGQLSEALTATTVAGSFSVSASCPGVATPAAFSLTNTAGAAANIAVASGTGQGATVNTAFSPLVVKVTDGFGNAVAGVSVTFTAPASSGASGTFSNSSITITGSTNAS